MAEVKTEQEPSIEEILESIRQIISEDGDAAAKPAPETKLEVVQPAPIPPSNLSLTPEKPAELPKGPELSLTPEAPKKPEPMPLDLTDKITPVAPPAAPPPPPPAPVAEAEDEKSSDTIEMMDSPMTNKDTATPLISQEAASAATDALSKLLAGNVAVESEAPGRTGKVTLEDMTRDLMKPLIKNWLDQNLPGIVEKIVQKEVEKLSNRAASR